MGRSSLSFMAMNDIWPLNLLIATLAMYFMYEAIYMVVTIVWIIFIFVFLVGFICGCTSVNVSSPTMIWKSIEFIFHHSNRI